MPQFEEKKSPVVLEKVFEVHTGGISKRDPDKQGHLRS